MEPPPTEADRIRQWRKNWSVVSEVMEREKVAFLRALTERQSAEIFDGLDCDLSMVWRPEERIFSSGLLEQQRIFARGHKNAPSIPRRT